MKKYCKRCIYDENTPSIEFDEDGICNYCKTIDNLQTQYKTGTPEGEKELHRILDEIKLAGQKRKYDCVVGISGGTDSSYLLARAVEWGLRPLAVLYDNTWNSSIATENIRKITSQLKVDLFTYVVDNKEADDIFRSFMYAGVPELDSSSDIAITEVLYMAAAKHKIKYILEGHSFKTEGIAPLGNNYFDGKYIESVHKKYGHQKMKTFPNLTFYRFMKWVLIKKIKKVRPFWYIDYSKTGAREYLKLKFGWEYYGGHHLENRMTAFLHTVWYPQRFNYDARSWSLSAAVRSGHMDRIEAVKTFETPIKPDQELIEYTKKRLGLTDTEYGKIMNGEKRTHKDFKTYKKRFEKLRPLFKILADANLVPMSFYLKYCFPLPANNK
ncbi:MAG: N-acetyl sugar amidotransferase [Prolixibacteraceae bacterium]|nr:N-acetyl sugar amidotransferase [Prolixibacteraceae bacterium]